MPDWPTLERVDDRRYAHALREGDATDVAHVYSGYAEPLFDYCHALLRDQQEAAAALHDSFVAAHAHIARLSDPERFRSWMYALARNEAIRRLNDPERPAERHEAPEVDNSFENADERSRRQEGRELMHSALSALTGRQRETIDLMLRHRLDAQDLVGILGIGIQEAGELATESRDRLEDALAAAAIARTGSGDCPSVAALMESGGWPLTPSLARKLVRHIDSCPVCGEQRRRKPSAARLIETLPVAMLPAELQRSVLTTVTSPELSTERAAIAAGAEPLDEHGWPAPVGVTAVREQGPRRRGHAAVWPVAAAAILVMLIGSVLIWLPGGSDRSSAQSRTSPGTGVLDASQSPPASPDDSGSPEPSPSPTVTASPSPTPTVSKTPTPTPTPSVTKTPTPTPTKKSPQPVVGRLVLVSNGCKAPVMMTTGNDGGCTITVRAVGGPVTWTALAGGGVTVKGGGRLPKGATGTASVTIPAGLCTAAGGNGSGSVTVAAKGSASNAPVNWTCPAAAAADPSSGPALTTAGRFTA